MVVAAVVVVVTMINLNRRRLLQHRQVGTANCLQTADGTTEPGGATLTLCVVRGSASSSGMQWVGVRKTWSNDLSIFFFSLPNFFFNQSASQFLLCFVVPD